MRIQPTLKNIACTVHSIQESEIVLPQGVNPLVPYGLVVAVGPDVDPKKIIIGDKILFLMDSAICVEDAGEKFFLINEDCAFAKYVLPFDETLTAQ